MSDYGTPGSPDPYGQQPNQPPNQPPPNPYGQPAPPNPYGQQPPPPPPYGQPAYAQAAYGQPGYGAPTYDYAGWISRVGATLLDGLLTVLAGIPLFIGYGVLIATAETSTNYDGTTRVDSAGSPIGIVLIIVGFLTYAGFFIWNTFVRQGRTGYSIGKGVLGIKLVSEGTGQPIGGGMCFVRQLAHILDSFCYIGYLWPLWDAKRQTFADKVLSTVVINQPKG